MSANSPDLILLAGTRDGLYRLSAGQDRTRWSCKGPVLPGADISHAVLDPRDGSIWAAVNSEECKSVYRSTDGGDSWTQAGGPFDADAVWHIEPGTRDEPRSVYAGVDPSNLYRTDDGGETWTLVEGFANHPSRAEWWPGGGGMCLHTIVTSRQNPERLFVAMSVGGMFASSDEGTSWEPRNSGIPSMAEVWTSESGQPAVHDVHRCSHKVVLDEQSGTLYQQNHLGVYRSSDEGRSWQDISEGLPDRFGFVIDVSTEGAVFVVPQHDWLPDVGVRISGQLAVYRSLDRGDTWTRHTTGLPVVDDMTMYREGMATDRFTPGGVYFGTSDGQIFGSLDCGESWTEITSNLPPVRSVSCGQVLK